MDMNFNLGVDRLGKPLKEWTHQIFLMIYSEVPTYGYLVLNIKTLTADIPGPIFKVPVIKQFFSPLW